MAYRISPIPDMETQRLGGLLSFLIDPTCGRYCLKSLLKYWHEKRGHGRITRLELPAMPWYHPRNYIGFDTYRDYPHAADLLDETHDVPAGAMTWEQKLRECNGPIILGGDGIGGATRGIGHAILLIGVNPMNPDAIFQYLDPLSGNQIKQAPLQPMQRRIDTLIYGRADIERRLARQHVNYFTRAR